MTIRLMVSVAAIALIAGVGYANAQGAGGGHESGGAAMHNSAGSGAAGGAGTSAAGGGAAGGTMENRDSAAPSQSTGSSEMKQSQSEQKSGAMKNERAEEKGQKSKSMSSENEKGGATKDMKAEGRQEKNGSTNAENREGGSKSNMNAEGRTNNNNMNAQTKTNERSQTTTGQAGAGAKLSTEQRTKITSVIHNEHVKSVTNVNFSVSVGTRVPHDVEFHPLPADVVTIYPEWRGYDFILVRDEIVIIDPSSYEIVAVINS